MDVLYDDRYEYLAPDRDRVPSIRRSSDFANSRWSDFQIGFGSASQQSIIAKPINVSSSNEFIDHYEYNYDIEIEKSSYH